MGSCATTWLWENERWADFKLSVFAAGKCWTRQALTGEAVTRKHPPHLLMLCWSDPWRACPTLTLCRLGP